MRKFLILTLLVTFCFNNAFGQNVEDVLSNYESKVLGKSDKSKFDKLSFQAVVNAQGMEMPVSLVKDGDDKMRLEMSVAGQNMVMVVNGDKGFVVIPGQGVQDVPSDVVKKQSEQMGSIGNYTFDKAKNVFNFAEEKDGCYVIEEASAKNPKKINATYYFNKESGLLSRVDARQEGINTVTVLKDYKDFNGVMLPSVIEAEAKGVKSVITVKSIEFDVPIMPYMFARPN